MRREQQGTIAVGLDGQPAVWGYRLGPDAGDGNRFLVVGLPLSGALTEVLIGAIAFELAPGDRLVSQELFSARLLVEPAISAAIELASGDTCTFTFHQLDQGPSTLFDSERELAYDCPTSVVAPLVDRMRDIWADGAAASIDGNTVPSVINLSEVEALAVLNALGLAVDVIPEANVKEPGLVFRQDPVPGTEVLAQMGLVRIYVSAGPDRVAVPDLEGLRLTQAIQLLSEAGLEIEGEPVLEASVDVPRDRVVRTQPPVQSLVPVGGRIILYLSTDVPRCRFRP